MRHVFRYPNDGDPRIIRPGQAKRYALADGIFFGPVPVGHSLVDDCNRRRRSVHVLQSQITTLEQRNPKRLKIFRADNLPAGETDIGRVKWTSFDSERIVALNSA